MENSEEPTLVCKAGDQILLYKTLGVRRYLCVEHIKTGWIQYPNFFRHKWASEKPEILNKGIKKALDRLARETYCPSDW